MAFTVFELTVRVMIFTLAIAIATLPAWAEDIARNAETSSRTEKEEFTIKTTVTPNPYNESQNATYSRYNVEVNNRTAINSLHDEIGTVTSAGSQPAIEAQSSQGQTPATSADSQSTTEAQSSQGQTAATTADSQPTSEAQSSLGQTPATSADSQSTTEAQSSQGQTPATSADSQSTTEAQSGQGQTAATSASPAPPCPTPPPGDDAVSRLRWLSSKEKGRRLREAAEDGRLGEVEALLAAGADVGARDEGMYGMSALDYAALKGHVEVARRLLGCGAEVGARDRWQRTPLHWAAVLGRTAVARQLLVASADPNARDAAGWTPLHWAANSGDTEMAATLLEWGADRGARDEDGRTPLDDARQYNRQQLIKLLT